MLRDIDLTGTSIDGARVDGLSINGVDVAELIEAELVRREPARALRGAVDPPRLRNAWALLNESWAGTYAIVAGDPAIADESVDGEWTFTQTLRHLVCATDIWLGGMIGNTPRCHAWGLPFSDFAEYVPGGADALGLDLAATPSYPEVLEVRRGRVADVRAFLADVTPERMSELVEGPPWMGGGTTTVLRCVHVVLNDEIEHHRFARRDLDILTTGRKASRPRDDR